MPVYIGGNKFCSENEVEIQKLYIIKIDGEWVEIGYDNHPNALDSSIQLSKFYKIYSDSPEGALEKYKTRLKVEARTLGKEADKLIAQMKRLDDKIKRLKLEDCEILEYKYDEFDRFF